MYTYNVFFFYRVCVGWIRLKWQRHWQNRNVDGILWCLTDLRFDNSALTLNLQIETSVRQKNTTVTPPVHRAVTLNDPFSVLAGKGISKVPLFSKSRRGWWHWTKSIHIDYNNLNSIELFQINNLNNSWSAESENWLCRWISLRQINSYT